MNLSQPFFIEKRNGENHIDLNGKWEFTYEDVRAEDVNALSFSHTATLPASAYMNMYEAGILPHPYKADNSKLYRDLDRKSWYYKRVFTLDEAPDPSLKNAFLCFDGVAYYSRVWLNGELIGEHEGMFAGPVADVADKLVKGENTLIVEVLAFNWFQPEEKKSYYSKAYNGIDSTEIVPWNIAKDSLTSNGDFTVIGIWRDVRIEILDKTHISRPYLYTESIGNIDEEGRADALLKFEVSVATDEINELACLLSDDNWAFGFAYPDGLSGIMSSRVVNINIEIADAETNERIYAKAEDFPLYDYDKSGIAPKMRECRYYRRDIRLSKAKLWYPVGLGKPNLYKVKAEIRCGGVLLDTLYFNTGVRIIEQTEGAGSKYRQRWCKYRMSVNGKEFFVKGMNWMPVDYLYTISDEDYIWTLEQAKNCGIGLLRIWSGGGMPEDDRFYDYCDKEGILVWQDAFMANSARPKWNSKILENQLCANIFRIRNHPALAVHCGGNEHQAYIANNNAAMYIMQRNFEDLDPSRRFYRTTPDGGGMHSYRDWEPIWYRKAYKDLPLMAECGIHSFPNAKSLRQLIKPEEFNSSINGIMEESFRSRFPELINHFTEYHPERIPRMLSRATHIDSILNMTVTELCEATQISAYEFYQILVQSMRERWPVTCGLMPWVFKRHWTTTAIQLVDGLGDTTASYYAVKKNYAPIIVFASIDEIDYAPGENVTFPIKAINESGENIVGVAVLDIFSPELVKISSTQKDIAISADDYLTEIFSPEFAIPTDWAQKDFFLRVSLLDRDGASVASSFYPLKCLEALLDENYRRDFREKPHENLYFENGPFMKRQISAAKRGSIFAEILKNERHGERVSLTVKLKASVPMYPVKLEITDDSAVSYLSDSFFFMDEGEEKTVKIETRNLGAPDRELNLDITAWNIETVSMKV